MNCSQSPVTAAKRRQRSDVLINQPSKGLEEENRKRALDEVKKKGFRGVSNLL